MLEEDKSVEPAPQLEVDSKTKKLKLHQENNY